jgi:hypothetical protein
MARAKCGHFERLPGEARDERTLPALEPPKNARYSFRNAEFVTRPWDLKRRNGAQTGIHYAGSRDPRLHDGRIGLPADAGRVLLVQPPLIGKNCA